MLIAVPRVFYDDHKGRHLPTPPVVRVRKRHYLIDSAHVHTPELMADAEHYADPRCEFDAGYRGLIRSARATVATLRAACVIAKSSQDA